MTIPIDRADKPARGSDLADGTAARPFGGIDLHRLFSIFQRHLRVFLAISISVFVVVVVITANATPLYTATASVAIDNRQERVVDTEAVLSGLPADSGTVDTEVEILRSRQLAERVVDALNLTESAEFNPAVRDPGATRPITEQINRLLGRGPAETPAAMTELQKQRLKDAVIDKVLRRLSIKRVGVTYVMNISFVSANPTTASRIANGFADQYLVDQLEAKFGATRQANVWLNGRLATLREEVIQAETAVEQYRVANNLLSASGTTLTEQEISAYNQQLATVRAQQAEADARLRTARDQLAAGSSGDDVGEALGSAVVSGLRARRAEISGRVADLESRYGPRHPDLLRAQRELADIDVQIQAEIRRLISNLEAQARVARERTASMSASLGSARGSLAANNAARIRLNELERNAESVRTLYSGFLDRFRETTSQEGVAESDARIVSKAKVPTYQSAPNVRQNLLVGLLLALAAGVGSVVLAEMLGSGITTSEELEATFGMPALGSVPLLSSVADPADHHKLPADYLIEKPLSSFAESIRSLRTAMLSSRIGERVTVVAVSSPLPGDGKTTASICLARSSAMAGLRVVLVDCDLRRRNVNRMLGIEPALGLIDVLNDESRLQEALILDEASGAHVLALTKNSFTPKDVFSSAAMTRLTTQLRSMYDLVIFDTAPVLAVSDTRVLAGLADSTVLLVHWRKTPEKAVTASLKLLKQTGAVVGGLALTQVNMKKQARYGYGDAGYYYSEYKKYYAA